MSPFASLHGYSFLHTASVTTTATSATTELPLLLPPLHLLILSQIQTLLRQSTAQGMTGRCEKCYEARLKHDPSDATFCQSARLLFLNIVSTTTTAIQPLRLLLLWLSTPEIVIARYGSADVQGWNAGSPMPLLARHGDEVNPGSNDIILHQAVHQLFVGATIKCLHNQNVFDNRFFHFWQKCGFWICWNAACGTALRRKACAANYIHSDFVSAAKLSFGNQTAYNQSWKWNSKLFFML